MTDLVNSNKDGSDNSMTIPFHLLYVTKQLAKEIRSSGYSNSLTNDLSLSMVLSAQSFSKGRYIEGINILLTSFKKITVEEIKVNFSSYQDLWEGLGPLMIYVKSLYDKCYFSDYNEVHFIVEPFIEISQFLECAMLVADTEDISLCILPSSMSSEGGLYEDVGKGKDQIESWDKIFAKYFPGTY